MNRRAREWQLLYERLGRSLGLLGIESAFGDADYWLVDGDYGDTTHKVCVHRETYLSPALMKAIQESLEDFLRWRVMLQIELPAAGIPDASFSGLIVYPDSIEEHWDREHARIFARRLGL